MPTAGRIIHFLSYFCEVNSDKKTLFCILLVAVMLFLAACQNPLVYMRKPCNQPNTVWQSEDGRITFTVGNKYDWSATGSIQLDGENVEFYLTCTTGSGIVLYPLEKATGIFYAEDQYEYWVCDYKSKRKFIATVRETTFFQPGEQIVFYRVEP